MMEIAKRKVYIEFSIDILKNILQTFLDKYSTLS